MAYSMNGRITDHGMPWTTLFMSVLFCSASAAAPRGVDLAALDGWDIVIAADANASEKYAAQELQQHVARATGLTLPIMSKSDLTLPTSR
jgi:hypothetical protein